ncbi:MAG: cob(I)yrinic acid a,c-diamide adenosyltransferase [Verrucomicrobiota bacterium]
MSIATKRGDEGQTDLLYGKRVSKTDLRVLANSKIDELNARLGIARAHLKQPAPETAEWIKGIQNDLFAAMGEIALDPEDYARHEASEYPRLDDRFLEKIEARLAAGEKETGKMTGWSVPGESHPSAALHLARTACRQAEVALVQLKENDLLNPAKAELILKGFNRLSDLLWIEARLTEKK